MDDTTKYWLMGIASVLIFVIMIAGLMVGILEYRVQISIEEAKAKLEAEKLNAQSEVERAKGVAEANKIIGASLQDNESYLRYLWVKGLHDGSSEVIYIPTEANLPILEATRKSK